MERAPKLPGTVVALGVASALNDMATELAVRLSPLFLRNVLGVEAGLVGLIEGIAQSTSILLKLASGVASDRMKSRKPLALAGYLLSNAAKPVLALAASWPVVLGLRFLDRVGKGVRTSPRDALIADSVPADQRGRAFGLHRALDPIGSVVGLGLAAAIVYARLGHTATIDAETFRLLAVVAAAPALLAVLVVALAVREPPRAPAEASPSPRGPVPRELRVYLAAVLVFNLSAASDAFFVLRAQELGLPLWASLVLVGATNLALALVSFPTGALSDRFGRRRFLAAGWLLHGAVLVGLALATTPVHLVIAFAGYGLYQGLTEGVEKALLTDLAPAESRGTGFGLYYGLAGLAALPANLLTGTIAARAGYPAAFATGAVIAASGACLLAFVPSPRSRAQGSSC